MHMRLSRFVATAWLLAAPSLLASEVTPANVVRVMNEYRRMHHLPDLVEDTRLDAAAADRIAQMLEQGYWAHISPTGATPFALFGAHGYQYERAAENLAKGFDTAEVLVEAWMESPGHRENILSPDYREVGAAAIDGSTTGRAAGRSVVMLFGKELAQVSRGRSK